MKSFKHIILLFILFIINMASVKAVDEYIVQINANGGIQVRDAATSEVLAYDVYKNDVVYGYDSQGNNAILIKPGVHIDYMNILTDMMITSYGEEVYVNIIRCTGDLQLLSFNAKTYNTSNPNAVGNSGSNRIYSSISVAKDLTIRNSTIINDISGVANGSVSSKTLSIDNSTLDVYSVLASGSSLSITNNSTLNLFGVSCYPASGTCSITISDSHIYVTNSLDDVTIKYIQNTSGDILIENSYIVNNGFISSDSITVRDSNIIVDPDKEKLTLINEFDDMTVENSTMESYSKFLIKNNLSLSDSSLSIDAVINEKLLNANSVDGYATSSLSVVNNIELNNSNLKVKHIGNVPSFIIGGVFISDDESLGFVDKDSNILELKKVSVSEDGYLANPKNSQFFVNAAVYPSTFTEGYALFLNDEISDTFENKSIDTITFKIKNGKWEDDTTDDKVLKIIRGTTINKDTLKSKGNSDDLELIITKTGDNEYTYEYVEKKKEEVENPKTGVKEFISLLILSLLGVVLVIYNKKKLSLFKNV